MAMQTIYLFDFDGTLTRRDSLVSILLRAGSRWKLAMSLFKLSPMMVAAKLGLISSGKAKERLLASYFKGMKVEQFAALCQQFADQEQEIWRPRAIEYLKQRQQNGDRCIVVTASIDTWVRPFLDKLFPEIELIATRMEAIDGCLTGRFQTKNCRGAEKVSRLEQIIRPEQRHLYHLIAFGDSHGDTAMLAYSDEGHYRYFE